MTPVIDDNAFAGADKGLTVPMRRISDGIYQLSIRNLDHADPPAPYAPGGVPRDAGFNRNVVALPVAGGMPAIRVECTIAGFDPASVPLKWRLQSLHVVGRHTKTGSDAAKNPHYKSLVVRLRDEWRGESRTPDFSLFAADAHATDHVGGGHAILTVAVRPPGASGWLQDFVHLRLTGTNPTEADVRAHIAKVAATRDARFAPMLDAIFAWEAGFKQFKPTGQSWTKYKSVRFDWPDDPPDFPVAAFDFGVGLSQYTHPGSLTASVAWDWRDNMDAGINIFLAALRSNYRAGMTWAEWAWIGWKRYNGSATYADDRAKSADGKAVSPAKIPAVTDISAITAALPLVKAPKWPVWPVTGLDAMVTESVAHTDAAATRSIDTIVTAVTERIQHAETLTWLWPMIEGQLKNVQARDGQSLFPGVTSEAAADLAALGRARQDTVLRMAFVASLARIKARQPGAGGPVPEGVAAMVPETAATDLNSEWSQLSVFVQKNIQNGFAGYTALRDRLFAKFGAAGYPKTAIPRVNAYYKQLTAAGFPSPGFKSPIHPDLKARLSRAAALLAAKGASVKLDPVKSVGGFAIRPNVNSPTELSNHSFGWAADIDPTVNPNIKISTDLRALIRSITGTDLYGAESTRLRTPAPYADLLPAATALSQASATFVAAFKSDASLAAALDPAIRRLGNVPLSQADLDAILAFARTQPANKAGIKALLASRGAPAAVQTAIATLCVQAVDLQRRAKAVTKPEVIGSDKTIARFGFFNLAPEVAAALVASDGGALRWLGASNGTKDFMHIELYPADAPSMF